MPAKALLYCAGGGIGDSLMASVVARALHAKYDRVDALTLAGHAETLRRVPDVDAVLVDEGGADIELAGLLKPLGYDAAIVTWATPRAARVPQIAGIPVRVGQSRRLYSRRFTHRVDVRSENGDLTTHWSQILLDYARAIGCDTDDAVPRFVPTEADRNEAAALIQECAAQQFVVLHPASAVATQRNMWPTGGWTRLAAALRDAYGLPVLVSGSVADTALVNEIARGSGARGIAGRLSIGAFGALTARCTVFAGITTGTMHVAAASGAPTVGIFPFQTDTPERWAPLGERTTVVRATYPCRPGERKETCPDYACIEALDVPRIVAAARALSEAAPAL